VRLREYDNVAGITKTNMSEKRNGDCKFGVSKRSSMKKERQAVDGMEKLLRNFCGPVKLKDPDCALYVFRGLSGANMMLVQKVASGASAQFIAPKTRICITTTPLCPLSSFIMCNVGRVKEGDRVLDPYSGSCSTLLACAIISPTIQTVGIDLAYDKVINRDAVMSDFESRELMPPLGLINGDCTERHIRVQARNAVGGQAFDLIVADPPYGRREKISKDTKSPLQQLIDCIRKDYESKTPLLRKGGRLVVFVPVSREENIENILPPKSELALSRLKLMSQTEQPLSQTLSRWLLVYEQG
jgi:tRNA G10  N-methylase Trm11